VLVVVVVVVAVFTSAFFFGDHQLLNFPVNGRKRDAGYSFVILELQ